MALDTLRAAVWTPSDVPLDRAGRRLSGWRDCPVCTELYYSLIRKPFVVIEEFLKHTVFLINMQAKVPNKLRLGIARAI